MINNHNRFIYGRTHGTLDADWGSACAAVAVAGVCETWDRGLGAADTERGRVSPVVNEAALGAFMASVEKRALRMAQIVTRDRDEALDIVQDSLIRLSSHYAARPAAEWPPLFYRILNNRMRDWQRRQAVRNRLMFWRPSADDEDDRDPLSNLPDPRVPEMSQRLAQGEAMKALEAALHELPARQREAFALRVWEGLSVEQTAQAMGCSEGSVKTHLFRALATLRRQLEGIWP